MSLTSQWNTTAFFHQPESGNEIRQGIEYRYPCVSVCGRTSQSDCSPGSTGYDDDDDDDDDDDYKHIIALERLGDDIELLLDQVPNIVLAIENSVSHLAGIR